MKCEACERDDHENCVMGSCCDCEDEDDGAAMFPEFDPYEDDAPELMCQCGYSPAGNMCSCGAPLCVRCNEMGVGICDACTKEDR